MPRSGSFLGFSADDDRQTNNNTLCRYRYRRYSAVSPYKNAVLVRSPSPRPLLHMNLYINLTAL